MSLALLTFSTSKFLWSRENKTFTVEISELGVPAMGRIGFAVTEPTFMLRSAETGDEMIMELDVINRDRENDIESWVYRPLSDEHDFKVTIYND